MISFTKVILSVWKICICMSTNILTHTCSYTYNKILNEQSSVMSVVVVTKMRCSFSKMHNSLQPLSPKLGNIIFAYLNMTFHSFAKWNLFLPHKLKGTKKLFTNVVPKNSFFKNSFLSSIDMRRKFKNGFLIFLVSTSTNFLQEMK